MKTTCFVCYLLVGCVLVSVMRICRCRCRCMNHHSLHVLFLLLEIRKTWRICVPSNQPRLGLFQCSVPPSTYVAAHRCEHNKCIRPCFQQDAKEDTIIIVTFIFWDVMSVECALAFMEKRNKYFSACEFVSL